MPEPEARIKLVLDERQFRRAIRMSDRQFKQLRRTVEANASRMQLAVNAVTLRIRALSTALKAAAASAAAMWASISGPILAAVAAIGGATYAVKRFGDAFADTEKSVQRLRTALKLVNREGQFTVMADAAARIAQDTLFSDEDIRRAMAYGITMRGTTKGIEDITRAAAGLATLMETDLKEGIRKVNEGLAGQYDSLAEIWPEIRKMNSEQEKAIFVANQFETAATFAYDATRTYAGQVDQLRKRWQDLAARIGRLVLPVLEAMVTVFEKLIAGMERYLDLLNAGTMALRYFWGEFKKGWQAAQKWVDESAATIDRWLALLFGIRKVSTGVITGGRGGITATPTAAESEPSMRKKRVDDTRKGVFDALMDFVGTNDQPTGSSMLARLLGPQGVQLLKSMTALPQLGQALALPIRPPGMGLQTWADVNRQSEEMHRSKQISLSKTRNSLLQDIVDNTAGRVPALFG